MKIINNPNSLAYIAESPININGIQGKRLMSIYRTKGCSYGKCTMCNFSHYAMPEITEQNIKNQHRQTLEKLTSGEFSHLDLSGLGNFYDDKEFSPEIRKYLLESLSEIKSLKRILTESRREFVTEEKLLQAKSYLRGNQILEFAFGYETLHETIRNKVLKKNVPEKYLDESLIMCKNTGVNFVSYVLIKPLPLSESDGVKEAINTAIHVFEKANNYDVNARIAFEPIFVTEGILKKLYNLGGYNPPKLWSIAEVLIQVAEKLKTENLKGKLFVGLSDKGLSHDRVPLNCPVCSQEVKSAIQEFNGHQEIKKFEALGCECKEIWEYEAMI